ncbi:hypothetical protein F5144DRAFT_80126 [Chaetomium tenue]|uniref:Uncharacterized protein n=1 Tax=Chaetomium tenue TaxID=1854479 RepID=A0ACB7PPR4_9PEZI|nr:hypothetical protein F5144DRAFT_80126 [Chaetomium globosum]
MRALIAFPFAAADCEVNLAVVCYLPFSLARSLAPKDSPAKSSGIQNSPCLHLPTPSCRACLISVTHTPAARNPSLPAHRRASCVCESLTHWNGSATLRKRGRRAGFTPRVSKRGKLHRTGEKKNMPGALGATAAAARQHRNPRCVGHSPACLDNPALNGCEGKGGWHFFVTGLIG